MKTLKLSVFIAGWLTCVCGAADAAQAFHLTKPALMVGLGDSISAAALADTSTQKELMFPWELPIPNLDSLLYEFGFNSDFENKRTLSWVSGVTIQSHYRRLYDYMKTKGVRVLTLNFAETGAVSAQLLDQVDEIKTALKFGVFSSFPYVTLLVGSNDICKSVPIEKFHKNIHEIFEKIAAILPPDGQPVHILVSSIPKLANLGEERVLNYRTAAGYRCRAIRTLPWSYCKVMTDWKTEEEHQRLNAKVDEVNEILRSETLEAADKYPQIQTYFSSAVSEYQVEPTDLAMDCFHPNQIGQEKIAELLWHEQPWFR